MAASDIPLKSYGVSGDLQEMTPSEENYLAYRAGIQLKNTITDVNGGTDQGDLTLTVDGHSIGSFVDTFYNETDGTHPVSAITAGSITTTLYQRDGTSSYSSLNYHRPIGYNTIGSVGIHEFTDSDMDTLCTRLNARIALSDYPGTFKLGSVSPSVDYSTFISGVFEDTVGGDSPIVYNIYRRDAMTAPTTIKPMKLLGSDSASSFSGIQELNDDEMEFTFGQHCKTLRGKSGAIGSYQLRSATQGTPSDPGTWSAKGTATNTKRTTSEPA